MLLEPKSFIIISSSFKKLFVVRGAVELSIKRGIVVYAVIKCKILFNLSCFGFVMNQQL